MTLPKNERITVRCAACGAEPGVPCNHMMSVDEALQEMAEHCREIRIKAERIATARRCAEIARQLAATYDTFDEDSACLGVAKLISDEFGLEEE